MTVMITLNKIHEVLPYDEWNKVYESHKHLGADTDFPLSSVLESNGLEGALWCLKGLPEHIEIPKRFALWCARDVQHLMTEERSINALDIAERYLDGNATREELEAAAIAAHAAYSARAAAAYSAVYAVRDAYSAAAAAFAAKVAIAAVCVAAIAAAIAAAVYAAARAAYASAAADAAVYAATRKRQINKLREMLN